MRAIKFRHPDQDVANKWWNSLTLREKRKHQHMSGIHKETDAARLVLYAYAHQ